MVLRENKWSVFLTRFAGHVSSGAYKKTDYSAWRDMKSWHGADIWINGGKYTVEDIDCPFNYHDFDAKDGSFGQYINDVWLEQSSNTELKADYMAWEKDCKRIDDAEVASLVSEIKPVQYVLDEDGTIRYIDPVTGDFINIGDVKASAGLTASVSAESNTCSTATTSNSANTVSSVKVSPVIDGTMIDYDDCVVKGDTINSGLIGVWDGIDIKLDEFVSKDEFYEIVEDMKNRLATKMDIEHYNNEKENNNNMKMFGNFDFGRVDGNTVRMSMYGLAVKNQSNTWVSYNANTSEVIDVDIMNFDGAEFMYKVPVALNTVNVGDVLIHARKPMFVTGIADGKFTAIDVIAGEEKIILPTKSPFNFNFVTKVISLINFNTMGTPNEANPFGNIGLMMALSGENNMKDILPFMLMTGQNGMDMSNPMSMYFMMKMLNGDKAENDDSLMMAMMLGAFNTPQGKTE